MAFSFYTLPEPIPAGRQAEVSCRGLTLGGHFAVLSDLESALLTVGYST